MKPSTTLLSLLFATGLLQFPGVAAANPNNFSAEAKLIIAEADIGNAMDKLHLKDSDAITEEVCFFDTADLALKALNLNLRARQKGNGPGDSTVKLRKDAASPDAGPPGFDKMEEDWTARDCYKKSYSLGNKGVPAGNVPSVVAATGSVRGLFISGQTDVVEGAAGTDIWDKLKRFGPAQAAIWEDVMLDGCPEPATVERWILQKDGKQRVIFEISAKKKHLQSDADATAFVKAFFDAADAAKLGTATGETKTAVVLDFFNPGR